MGRRFPTPGQDRWDPDTSYPLAVTVSHVWAFLIHKLDKFICNIWSHISIMASWVCKVLWKTGSRQTFVSKPAFIFIQEKKHLSSRWQWPSFQDEGVGIKRFCICHFAFMLKRAKVSGRLVGCGVEQVFTLIKTFRVGAGGRCPPWKIGEAPFGKGVSPISSAALHPAEDKATWP